MIGMWGPSDSGGQIVIQMSVLPNHFALAEIKPAAQTEQPGVARVSKASSGHLDVEYRQAGQGRQPTELEIRMARELAEAGMTGPPPAFQISVLEAQSDIRYVIKQMEKAHEQAATDKAIAPAPTETAEMSSPDAPSGTPKG